VALTLSQANIYYVFYAAFICIPNSKNEENKKLNMNILKLETKREKLHC
jgi:hypothetical protein